MNLMGLLGQWSPQSGGEGGGIMGLLGNPAFQTGMGLLSAGYDSRINPYQAAMQGMGNAQQIKWLEQKRKREEEAQQRMEKAREQFVGITGQQTLQNPVQGPPMPGGQMPMQETPNPNFNPMLAAAGQAAEDPGDLVSLLAIQQRIQESMEPNKRFNPVTPSGYTPESLQRYAETGRYSDLVPYEPYKDVTIGGVKHTFSPALGRYVPAVVEGERVTPESTGDMQGRVAATAADVEDRAARRRGAPQELDSIDALQSELDWAVNNKDQFLSVFGAAQGRTPDIRQSAVDAEAKRKRIASLLTLAARGALKGQGQISDFESRILGDAATLLNDRTISDAEAMAEVARLREALGARRSRVPGVVPEDIESGFDEAEYNRLRQELLNK